MTACTPATARAGAVSRDRMRAWGCGLRRVAPHTIPSIHRSEENANWPLVFAGASGRSTLSPRPGARRLRVKVLGRLGAGTGALLLDGVAAELGRAPLVGDGGGGLAGQLAEPGHRVRRGGHRVPVDLAGDELLGGGRPQRARRHRSEPEPDAAARLVP